MNLPSPSLTLAGLRGRIRGMFNLNDPRWGRGDDKNEGQRPEGNKGPNQGPPDLDELWRDFNRKLGGLFGGRRGGGGGFGGGNNNGGGGGFQPDMKSAGVGAGLIAIVVVIIWLGTGIFIVQEGQQAVITRFGQYHSTVGAGINWRLPYPIERHEVVYVTQIRSVDVGRDTVVRSTGLRESAMLTQDENIVEIKLVVQYRLKNARDWLFNSRNPQEAVVLAAESAVRAVVGNMLMDAALSEERENIAPRVRQMLQQIVDRYALGVDVVAVQLQQGGVRPPEQVQAAFDDVLRAGQEGERAKNEAQAYANDVVPRAQGAAARLREEAQGYKATIVAQAQGDADRFKLLLAEYQRSPQVTRDRLYVDAMQQIYGNVTKILVDARSGNNMLFLPLDRIIQQVAQGGVAADPGAALQQPPAANSVPPLAGDARTRDNARSRERETR